MKVQLDHTIYKVEENNVNDITAISFKGDKNAETAFIYRPGKKDLEPEHQKLIENIITKGLNLDKDKVLLIDLELSQAKAFNRINRFFNLKNVILLGITPSEMALNLDIENNNVVNFNGKKLLFTDTLDSFIENKEAKMAFWLALQRMFNLR